MPYYDFYCPDCQTEWEEYTRLMGISLCKGCGEVGQRLISRPNINPDYEPYYDKAIDGWVKSRAHRREIMRRHDMQECG